MESAGPTTERFLKMIFFILLSSLGVYWVVMQTLHPAARIDPLLTSVLTALAAVTAIAIFFVRFVYIEKMLQEHAGRPAVRSFLASAKLTLCVTCFVRW